jgi:hypothetical protein
LQTGSRVLGSFVQGAFHLLCLVLHGNLLTLYLDPNWDRSAW